MPLALFILLSSSNSLEDFRTRWAYGFLYGHLENLTKQIYKKILRKGNQNGKI